MPIEVKEVVIRAVVSGTGSGEAKPAGKSGDDQAAGSPDNTVQEAVRQILEILKDKEER